MKKNPLFVAVSNQKGGVGKSTMLVTLASLLNYSMGKNVAIVDCDATQRSLFNLRERDMEMVEINKKYMVLLEEQRLRGCRIYPIRQAKPENARPVSYTHLDVYKRQVPNECFTVVVIHSPAD